MANSYLNKTASNGERKKCTFSAWVKKGLSGSGSSTLTGTESGATADTTYTFTITATDAEGQTAAREFTLTFNFGANNSGQFN